MAEKRRFFMPRLESLADVRRFLAEIVRYLNDLADSLPAVTTGSASFTDNAVMRADGTDGSIQDSDATIDDSGNLTIPTGDLYVVAGSVAIGASSTALDLEVKGATGVDAVARVTTGGGGVPALAIYDGDRDWRIQINPTSNPFEISNETLGVVPVTIANDSNNDDAVRIDGTGRVGIGPTSPAAQLDVDQDLPTAAIPVLRLDQADVSEEMIEFETTIGTGNAIEAVGAKTLTTTHFIKVTLPGGLTRYIPVGTIA